MALSATEHNLSWPNLILLENIRFSHRVFSEFFYITGDVYNKKSGRILIPATFAK